MDRNRNKNRTKTKDQQPAGLPDSEIQRYQTILESLRKETSKSLQSLSDETRNGDPVDQTTEDPGSTLSREDLFQETDRRQIMVRRIDAALARIQQGTFGVCVSCGANSGVADSRPCPGPSTACHARKSSSRRQKENLAPKRRTVAGEGGMRLSIRRV